MCVCKAIHSGACLHLQHKEYEDSHIVGMSWPSSLLYLVSSGPIRECLKNIRWEESKKQSRLSINLRRIHIQTERRGERDRDRNRG